MSTSPNEGTSDLATGSPTEPDEYYLDPAEWQEVDPADWPESWPDSELDLTAEVEPCHS